MRIGEAISKGATQVTKDWTAYRKKEFRDAARGRRAREELYRGRVWEVSIKDAAYEVMEEAYLKASGGGRLPANARQVMYAARPLIMARTDKRLSKDFDQYFTQQLLPGYMMQYPERTAQWDVVFDARGHLWEPHTEREIQLGTLAVRRYLAEIKQAETPTLDAPEELDADYPTTGPTHRYQNVLFIEKEGFMPLLQAAHIAERYDLAIMSTKGLASTAARSLMEGLHGVRFLVLHDFDKAGFSIVGTLQRDTRRYTFDNPPEVIDIGLRLKDVKAEGLAAEAVYYKERNPEWNLSENGATKKEIDFLVTGMRTGQRVELNAFTSDRFIDWLERKLEQHGVAKVVPDDETLAAAYRRVVYVHHVNATIEETHETARKAAEAARMPKDLRQKVERILDKHRETSWDLAVAQVAEQEHHINARRRRRAESGTKG